MESGRPSGSTSAMAIGNGFGRLAPVRLALQMPKLRKGACFPGSLEHRFTAEKALAAVIHEAGVQGVSTRSADELVEAMGTAGISKSQVSRLCEDIDERVGTILNRPLEGDWPLYGSMRFT
ncbi:hypothetical protein D9623_16080 [Azospirillum brasilense]|nr:hypothetical protein [Azospirillum brasilense]NUB30078.1 hypothetical protein [Azospirillum brasilense]QEL91665.1 hypothetical protein D9621_15860 [Azospirillum brasilense]QEL97960.1 hypothetical protein D9623_16080 [Azospirillum brasilense]RIV97249.1 hypothetical protein D2T81_29255 [Azospirillum brasilense]